jgi:hypothetical protein
MPALVGTLCRTYRRIPRIPGQATPNEGDCRKGRAVARDQTAPQLFCFLGIPKQATRTAHGDIHIFLRIGVSQTHPCVVMELVHLRSTPIRKKPKRSIGFNLQRLNRPSVEAAIAINSSKKCDSNISNQLAQPGEVTGVRVRHLLKHYKILRQPLLGNKPRRTHSMRHYASGTSQIAGANVDQSDCNSSESPCRWHHGHGVGIS